MISSINWEVVSIVACETTLRPKKRLRDERLIRVRKHSHIRRMNFRLNGCGVFRIDQGSHCPFSSIFAEKCTFFSLARSTMVWEHRFPAPSTHSSRPVSPTFLGVPWEFTVLLEVFGLHRVMQKTLRGFVVDLYEHLELRYPKLRLEESAYGLCLAAPEVNTYAGKHG